MKAAVVTPYYNQHSLWARFCQGLEQNLDAISRVIVISDGPVDAPLSLPFDLPLIVEELPHCGSPVLASNRGMTLAKDLGEDLVFHTNADIVVGEDTIVGLIEHWEPRTLCLGPIHNVSIYEQGFYDNYSWPIIEHDWKAINKVHDRIRWSLVHCGSLLIAPEDFLGVGGFQPDFVNYFYAFEDKEFGVRFQIKHGPKAIKFDSDLPCFHLTDIEANVGRSKLVPLEAWNTLASGLGILYGHNYTFLWNSEDADVTSGFGVYDRSTHNRVSVIADCLNPTWIQDSSAVSIQENLPIPRLYPHEVYSHLSTVALKLAPGGVFRLVVNRSKICTEDAIIAHLLSCGLNVVSNTNGLLEMVKEC